jgi:hypothetical protein
MPPRSASKRRNADRGDAAIAHVEKTRTAWTCSVCLELALPYTDPIFLEPCAHVYHRICILNHVATKPAGTQAISCPECSVRFAPTKDIKNLKDNQFAWRALMNLLIDCVNECGWSGDVGDLDAHLGTGCDKAKCADCASVVKPPETIAVGLHTF